MSVIVRRRIAKGYLAVVAVVFFAVIVVAIIPGHHSAVLETVALVTGSISMASMSAFLWSTRGSK